MRNSTTVRIALAIASIATFVPAARAADVAQTTTYEIGQFALAANHARGFVITGGVKGVYCDPYTAALPTKIICQTHTNIPNGRCIITVNMAKNGYARGQVACGNEWRTLRAGVKAWGFSVKYRWDKKAYAWTERFQYGTPA